MVAWFPSVPGSLTDGISFLILTLYLKTNYSLEDWGTLIDSDSAPFALLTIFSLTLLKRVNRPLSVNYSSSNSKSSYWSNTIWICELLDVTSLIQNSGSADVLLATVENISSNTK